MPNIALAIGNLNIVFKTPSKKLRSLIQGSYGPFITRRRSGVEVFADVSNKALSKNAMPRTSRSGGTLTISRYDFHSVTASGGKRTTLKVELNKYSFDSWLRVFITFLAQENNGILVHASGYVHKKMAYIFTGVSGSGKSTIIKLLRKDNALSDELLYVFSSGKRYFAAATPFWGELKRPAVPCTGSFPLKAVLFIKHGKKLNLEKLDTAGACAELLRTVMFFSSRREDIEQLLDGLAIFFKYVPCYSMFFAKNSKKEFILDMLGGL